MRALAGADLSGAELAHECPAAKAPTENNPNSTAQGTA